MEELDNVYFDRSLPADSSVNPPMLCVLANASQDAFGACAYIRHRKDEDTYTVIFIAAKSRVTPLKQLTIPRLELLAAVPAGRLAKVIQKESCAVWRGKVLYRQHNHLSQDRKPVSQFQAVRVFKGWRNSE